jgi:hypothetical protein
MHSSTKLRWAILVVMITFFFTTSNCFHLKSEDYLESRVQHILRDAAPKSVVKRIANEIRDEFWALRNDTGTGCQCVKYNCGCCVYMRVPEVHLDNTGCVNTSYLPDEYGVRVTMDIDKVVILNVTVSARNPPPICVGIPHLRKEASVCLYFYNLDVSKTHFSGCIRLEVHLRPIFVRKIDFGCFRIQLQNVAHAQAAQVLVDGITPVKPLR